MDAQPNTNMNMNSQVQRTPSNNSQSIQWIAIAIIVAALIIGGAVLYANPKGAANNNNGGTQQPAVDISKVKTEGSPFVGDANAPIVIAYWADYQCPFCKRFEEDAIKKAYDEYVKAGKVKIVFKDYQFLDSNSTRKDSQNAALASRAVWEIAPTKYYEWRIAVFGKQDEEHGGWGSKEDILALTQSIGIDSAAVNQLMTSKAAAYQAAIDADKTEGSSFGVNGTPGTIVGKQLISGAQSYAILKAAIDAVK